MYELVSMYVKLLSIAELKYEPIGDKNPSLNKHTFRNLGQQFPYLGPKFQYLQYELNCQ